MVRLRPLHFFTFPLFPFWLFTFTFLLFQHFVPPWDSQDSRNWRVVKHLRPCPTVPRFSSKSSRQNPRFSFLPFYFCLFTSRRLVPALSHPASGTRKPLILLRLRSKNRQFFEKIKKLFVNSDSGSAKGTRSKVGAQSSKIKDQRSKVKVQPSTINDPRSICQRSTFSVRDLTPSPHRFKYQMSDLADLANLAYFFLGN